jgi:hypothetical protein
VFKRFRESIAHPRGERNEKVRVRRACIMALAAGSVTLAGCAQREPETRKMTLLPGGASPRVPSGSDMVFGSSTAPRSTYEALGNIGTPGHSQAERDRIARADLYFKLEWAAKVVEGHTVPSQLRAEISKGRIAMQGVQSDRATAALLEALNIYDRALDSYQPDASTSEFSADSSLHPAIDPASVDAAYRHGKEGRHIKLTVQRPQPPPGDDVWATFRSARIHIDEAGRLLGLLDRRSSPYASSPFASNPLDADPLKL